MLKYTRIVEPAEFPLCFKDTLRIRRSLSPSLSLSLFSVGDDPFHVRLALPIQTESHPVRRLFPVCFALSLSQNQMTHFIDFLRGFNCFFGFILLSQQWGPQKSGPFGPLNSKYVSTSTLTANLSTHVVFNAA